MGIEVRDAVHDDAEAMCVVLCRSIKELCASNHKDDPETLDAWLNNKTPENVRSWIDSPDQRVLVAVGSEGVCGVGAVAASGEILLNYVSPDARFRGVSKMLLRHLEEHLCANGVTTATLTSTQIAHRFYLGAGYEDDGPPNTWRGGEVYQMRKVLAPLR